MATDPLQLLDWRRRVFELYREIRRSSDPRAAWTTWRATRAELFQTHAQSPLARATRLEFPGLRYFDYDPEARALGSVEEADPQTYDIPTSGGGSLRFVRFAVARFGLLGHRLALELYWLEGYGGGVFLPFSDVTSGVETYDGGRYLLDTIKGADLGDEDGRLVLDFNFAYNPSCAYDPRWVCPRVPAPNRLSVAIRAGERLGEGG